MDYTICRDCDYCKTDRRNEQGQVRCIRFSQFVNLNDRSCETYWNEEMKQLYEKMKRVDDLLKGGAQE